METLFTPAHIKGLQLKNRVVLPPMCMYKVSKEDGYVTDWHVHHYYERALGGVGLIIIEMTGIVPDGRITNKDLGLWEDGQIEGIARIVKACHEAGAKVGIQMGHAGRKAKDARQVVSSSTVPFSREYREPKELTISQIDSLLEAYGQFARRAVEAGVDCIEIHGAHGYLIHQFQSSLTNKRRDEYGQDLSLFGKKVIEATKKELPENMPLLMRLSAVEYAKGGYGLKECLAVAEKYKEAGVDVFHVSTGGESLVSPGGVRGPLPGYQLSYARAFKEALSVPVIAVGKLEDVALANSVITNKDADFVAIGRGMLRQPYWVHNGARELGEKSEVPLPYIRGFE